MVAEMEIMEEPVKMPAFEKNYIRYRRARMIVDSAVGAAFQNHGPIDPERAELAAHHIAKTAAALVMSRIYEDDAEIAALRMERDHYRKLAEDTLALTPRPILLEALPNPATPPASS